MRGAFASLSSYFGGLVTAHRVALLCFFVLGIVVLSGNGSRILSLLASSASSLDGHQAVLFFAPHKDELAVGEVSTIDVRVNAGVPINAVGATVLFPREFIEVVGISKATSFMDLWTEETTIREQRGEVRFSGGTLRPGGQQGLGTVVTLNVKAKRAGRAEITFQNAEIFAHDGRGRMVESDARSFAYVIAEAPQGGGSTGTSEEAPMPTPDLNNDGRVTLADVSIIAIQLLSPYNARYDLDRNGSLGLSDLSVIFSRMGGTR